MRRFVIAIALVIMLLLVAGSVALADGGPHGGFAPATDACAGCHRAHTGQASMLLKASSTSLCETCHGSAGTGADTNVWDGVYAERDGTVENPAEGVVGRGLKGGGFARAIMDTNDNGVADAASRAATSSHTYNGTSGTMWGNGANGSGAGGSIALACANCHNPHGKAGTGGTATYRILRPRPNGSNAGADVVVADETAKTYTIADATNSYWGQNYGTAEMSLNQWCAQCHTRYMGGTDSASTDTGDAIYRFRHTSGAENVSCVDCHVSHGTADRKSVV